MTLEEENPRVVFDLLRWLGPGAELVEPAPWRGAICDELSAMLAAYDSS